MQVPKAIVDRDLCTVQLSTPTYNAIVDALAIRDLEPLARVFESSDVLKVIHNASFERSVLAKLNLALVNVFDTLTASRRIRGKRIDGGHGLAAVCERELGRAVDKTEQTSDWTRRPLSERQIAYAALDGEVLLELHATFAAQMLV